MGIAENRKDSMDPAEVMGQNVASPKTTETSKEPQGTDAPKGKKVGRRSKEEIARIRQENEQALLETFPVCDTHPDCHGWKDGKCTVLTNNDFGGRDCPFYKNCDVNRREQRECLDKLIRDGRSDLMEKYKKSFEEFGLFSGTDEYTEQAAEELEQFSEECLRELLSQSDDPVEEGASAGQNASADTSSEEEDDWDD